MINNTLKYKKVSLLYTGLKTKHLTTDEDFPFRVELLSHQNFFTKK